MTPAEYQEPIFLEAVEARRQGGRRSREEALADMEMVLGWCADSLQCAMCELQLSGVGNKEITAQARRYGWRWKWNGEIQSAKSFCFACAADNAPTEDFPSDEELRRLIPSEQWG